MKRKHYLLFAVCCLLPVAFLWSCGNGPGAPGSSGSEDTGIEIQSASITVISNAGNSGGPDLDANIHICASNGKPEPGLFRDDATIALTTSRLNPNSSFDPFPATVVQCTVTYIKPTDNPGAPIIDQMTVFPNCSITEGSSSCIVNLIDIPRKEKFWSDIVTEANAGLGIPTLPVRYVASYDCAYMNDVGNTGRFQVQLEIFLTDFELCT